MKALLVVGIETVAGANLAAAWSENTRVIGISRSGGISLPDVECLTLNQVTREVASQSLQQSRASHVLFCGAAARSPWESASSLHDDSVDHWAEESARIGMHFTMITSDAVFTGPWMFHDECSESFCSSAEAIAIREAENRVRSACPGSLVVRTNAFGWNAGGQPGWIESLLTALENGDPIDNDPIAHATPIFVGDLADYLSAALEDELSGTFHIAGAERVNAHEFTRQLALEFKLPTPALRPLRELSTRPVGFGRGEMSLKSHRFCREYDCAMPLLGEGLQRMREQHESGYRDRLTGSSARSGKAA